jgi:hypothetical protein
MLGSVARSALRQAEVPILLVRGVATQKEPRPVQRVLEGVLDELLAVRHSTLCVVRHVRTDDTTHLLGVPSEAAERNEQSLCQGAIQ